MLFNVNLFSVAVRCANRKNASASVYYRKSGDTNVSNTPNANVEYSHRIGTGATTTKMVVFWVSSGLSIQITIHAGAVTVATAYPIEYLQ